MKGFGYAFDFAFVGIFKTSRVRRVAGGRFGGIGLLTHSFDYFELYIFLGGYWPCCFVCPGDSEVKQ